MIKVEIDEGSGFCFGVVTAIHKAEEELAKGETLYCLGDIVHNSREVERLKAMGLITINRDEFRQLRNAKVLLRAHGEFLIARAGTPCFLISSASVSPCSARALSGVTVTKSMAIGNSSPIIFS